MKRLPTALLIAAGSVLALGASVSPEEKPEEKKEVKQEKPKEKEETVEIFVCTDAGGTIVHQTDPCPVPKRRRIPVPQAEPPPVPKPVVLPTPAPARVPWPAPAILAPLERIPYAVSPRKVVRRGTDPRFDSPERTWKTFVAAVRSGDRFAVLACLTSSALEQRGARAESLRLEDLLATVNAITRVVSQGEVGPFWAIRGDRLRTRPKWIFLEQTERGDWKISAI